MKESNLVEGIVGRMMRLARIPPQVERAEFDIFKNGGPDELILRILKEQAYFAPQRCEIVLDFANLAKQFNGA